MRVRGFTTISMDAHRLLSELGYNVEDYWNDRVMAYSSFDIKEEDDCLFHRYGGDPETPGRLVTNKEWLVRSGRWVKD